MNSTEIFCDKTPYILSVGCGLLLACLSEILTPSDQPKFFNMLILVTLKNY